MASGVAVRIFEIKRTIQDWLMRKTSISAIRRVGDLSITIGTDIGVKRTENQDRLIVFRFPVSASRSFFAVVLSDGMGGMIDGAACASMAIASFVDSCINNMHLAIDERAMKAAMDSNYSVYENYKAAGGATLSAVIADGDGRAAMVNVGDSRIYNYCNHHLKQITTDDTLAAQFLSSSEKGYRKSNELLQYIGMGNDMEPHVFHVPSESDYVILTTDGLHYLGGEHMQMVFRSVEDPAICSRRLLEMSKWCGGHDNASISTIRVQDVLGYQAVCDRNLAIWDPYGELQVFFSENNKCFSPGDELSAAAKFGVDNESKKARKTEGLKQAAKSKQKSKTSNYKGDLSVKFDRRSDKVLAPLLSIEIGDGSSGKGKDNEDDA